MPSLELALFRQNLAFARTMTATATALELQFTSAIDVSDLLRAALVQGVSAFDHFIHEEVRVRMVGLLAVSKSQWPSAFQRFRVAMSSVDEATKTTSAAWLENEVRRQHGFLAFQHPEKVADAIRLVTDVELWSAVASDLGLTAADAKTRLQLIVDRRNKIAHEADTDPTPPRSRYPINRQLVDDSLDYLESVAASVVRVT